jgi:hypothetical protein
MSEVSWTTHCWAADAPDEDDDPLGESKLAFLLRRPCVHCGNPFNHSSHVMTLDQLREKMGVPKP